MTRHRRAWLTAGALPALPALPAVIAVGAIGAVGALAALGGGRWGGAVAAAAPGPAAPTASATSPASAASGPAAAGPEATGEARRQAEALFNRYIDLEHAFDPAQADLYADGAHIESRVIVAGRPPTVRTWSGNNYKDLLRRALKKAKETKKDLNYYSGITYQMEGSRVRIRAMRYAELQKAVSPVQLLVGPDAAGSWRIYEELSESHPLTAPPPPPKH